jgi:hypothetical protein
MAIRAQDDDIRQRALSDKVRALRHRVQVMALQSGRLEPVAEQAGWAEAAYLACVVVVFFGIPRQLRIPLEVIHLATESLALRVTPVGRLAFLVRDVC